MGERYSPPQTSNASLSSSPTPLTSQPLSTLARLDYYHSTITAALAAPPLLESDADLYLAEHPFTSGSFYPITPSIVTRSLSLTHSMFYVGNSKLVPGEKGLFAKRHFAKRSVRTFVGFYTGWLHDAHTPSPYSADRAYSLQLVPHTSISTASDDMITTSLKSQLFPIASANEYIWDPDSNTLQFDRHGKTFLHSGPAIVKGTELTVCLGIRGAYSWGHYIHHSHPLSSTSPLSNTNTLGVPTSPPTVSLLHMRNFHALKTTS